MGMWIRAVDGGWVAGDMGGDSGPHLSHIDMDGSLAFGQCLVFE